MLDPTFVVSVFLTLCGACFRLHSKSKANHILYVCYGRNPNYYSTKGRRQNTQQRMTKVDKSLLVSLQNSAILFVCKSRQRFDKSCLQFTKDIKLYRKQQLDVITRMTFNLTCGKDVTELQNLASLCLSSFAESHQMQQKNFDVSPNPGYYFTNGPYPLGRTQY